MIATHHEAALCRNRQQPLEFGTHGGFPRSGKISNALTGEVLAEQADRYTYPAQHGQTDIFRVD